MTEVSAAHHPPLVTKLSTAVDDERHSFGPRADNNAAAILSVLHERGQVSRSQVVQRTGRSRSSIADAVAELEAVGLVRQLPPSDSRRTGRPSMRLEPTERALVAAVNPDIDGIRVGLYTLDGTLLEESFARSSSNVSPEAATATVTRRIDDLKPRYPDSTVIGVCAAIPGWVDKSARHVERAPHLGWHEVSFADQLEAATGLPSRLVYDAVAGLAAEYLWGCARRMADVVYLYGGPGGIGAAALVDGRLLAGHRGHAGRLGHLIVAEDGPKCSCGNVGCLTSLVSAPKVGAALDRGRGREATRTPVSLRLSSSDDPTELMYIYVARALRLIGHVYDPSLIIMGGFFGLLLEHDRVLLETLLRGPAGATNDPIPSLVRPSLGDRHVLAGASHFALQDLLTDPLALAAQRFPPLVPHEPTPG